MSMRNSRFEKYSSLYRSLKS